MESTASMLTLIILLMQRYYFDQFHFRWLKMQHYQKSRFKKVISNLSDIGGLHN